MTTVTTPTIYTGKSILRCPEGDCTKIVRFQDTVFTDKSPKHTKEVRYNYLRKAHAAGRH